MSPRSVGTSDALHTHLTIGLRPVGECPACDQVHAVFNEGMDDVPNTVDPTDGMDEAEMAEYYYRTRDTSDFDLGHPEPISVQRNVSLSVRFNEEEITALREAADERDMTVIEYIKDVTLRSI